MLNNKIISGILRFDRSFFQLVIAAHSGILYTQTLIEIEIEDRNDNVPKFLGSRKLKYEIPEDAPVGFIICRQEAVDEDIGLNGRIRYFLVPRGEGEAEWPSDRMFRVDSTDGRLLIRTPLDREKKESYRFFILATNEDSSDPTMFKWVSETEIENRMDVLEISILVADVNDNGPGKRRVDV